MYCCYCGRPIPGQSRFCPLCGRPLPSAGTACWGPGAVPASYSPPQYASYPSCCWTAPYPAFSGPRRRPRRHPRVRIGLLTLGHTLLILLGTILFPAKLHTMPFAALVPDLLIFCTQTVCFIIYCWLTDRRTVAGLFTIEAACLAFHFMSLIKTVTGIEILLHGRFGAVLVLLGLLLRMGIRAAAMWMTGREYQLLRKQIPPEPVIPSKR